MVETYPEDVGISSTRLERLSRLVQGHVTSRRIPGAITMVARDGKVAHFQTYGSMDDEAGKPMAPDTIFRIYSMTKPIASVALMTLYEEGLFQLDDPVSKYVPEFKGVRVYAGGPASAFQTREPAREPTIRDMLSHTGGLAAQMTAAHPIVAELYRQSGITLIPDKGTLRDAMATLGRLPLAVQLVSGPGNEELLFGLAEQLETWPRHAPGF